MGVRVPPSAPCGGVAQLVRARGSYPRSRRFESYHRHIHTSEDLLKRVLFIFLPLIFLTTPKHLYPDTVGLISIKGPISPPQAQYVKRSLRQKGFSFFILTVDTPGGLDTSMREIVEAILSSKKPVVGYVYPKGARAASAGTFIMAACHIDAMAPGTSMGAAHPVMMGPTAEKKGKSILEKKILEDAASYIRSLAKMRKRSTRGYVLSVKKAKSFDAFEALRMGMIEIVAEDIDELLKKLDGKKIKINKKFFVFHTKKVKVLPIKPTAREKVLMVLGNPNIAYMLLMLGFYGLFFELTSPGAIFPGVLGSIFLVLGLYSMHVLPINYAGILMILLSFVLFLLEVKIPSHGALTLGGIVSFLIGSLFLIKNPYPYLRVSLTLVALLLGTTLVFFLVIVKKGISALGKKPVTGAEGLVGEEGVVIDVQEGNLFKVFVHGEIWNARSSEPLKRGDRIKVVGTKGLLLKVKKLGGDG